MGKDNISKQSTGVDVIPEKVSMYDTSNGSSGGKKKSLFEKLGLVEPVDQEDSNSETQAKVKEPEKKQPAQPSESSKASKPSNVVSISEEELFDPKQKGKIEKLSIEEIYTIYSLAPKTETNTVYLIDHFVKALPSNLPIEIKRQSLNSLLEASHINLSDLLNDGKERVETLNQYLENFTMDLEEIISENEREIQALKEKIAQHNQIIEERSRTLEEQKAVVKFEVEKISSIMDFVRSKDV